MERGILLLQANDCLSGRTRELWESKIGPVEGFEEIADRLCISGCTGDHDRTDGSVAEQLILNRIRLLVKPR